MLQIYPIILEFVTDIASLVPRIAHHDPDLARQLRRSSSSVALNVAEGMHARGRSKTAAYNVALREMRESYAALEVSVRLGYVAPLSGELERRIAQIEEQLEMLDSDLTAIKQTAMWNLKLMVDQEAAKGNDLITDMVRRLKRDILVASNRLDALRPPE